MILILFLIMSDIVIKKGKATLTLLDSLFQGQEGDFEPIQNLHRTQLWKRILMPAISV
jgi:hypothetical protein